MESICKEIDLGILHNLIHDDNITDELSIIMSKYDSDKGYGLYDEYIVNNKRASNFVCHNYTFYYNTLFSSIRNENITIFEMGVGVPSCMGSWAGSLLGWQEYFPNSKIFSADFDKNYLYNKDRITSYYVNQEDETSIKELWENMENESFDIIVDDGPHTYSSNYLFYINSIHKLKKKGIYIIEDIHLNFIDKLYDEILFWSNNNNVEIEIIKKIISYPKKFTHPSDNILNMNNLIFIKKIN
jgi:hypothetical protein